MEFMQGGEQASPESLHSAGRAGGCATPTGFAARAGAQANHSLTFNPDHSLRADQFRVPKSFKSNVEPRRTIPLVLLGIIEQSLWDAYLFSLP